MSKKAATAGVLYMKLSDFDSSDDSSDDEGEGPRAKRQKRSDSIAAILTCPITQELAFEAVIAEDGHVYERSAIEEYFSRKAGEQVPSPLTKVHISKHLSPAIAIKSTIESLIANGVITGDTADSWIAKDKEKKAMQGLIKKAEGGHVGAMGEVGHCYLYGKHGFKKDDQQALQWLRQGWDVYRDVYSLTQLGVMKTRSKEEAVQGMAYLSLAAGQGSDLAAYLVGRAMAMGNHGLPVMEADAMYWLQKAVSGTCSHKHLDEAGKRKAKKMLREMSIPRAVIEIV